MNPLDQHIQRINEKLQLLLKQQQLLQKENEKLKKELLALKQDQQERLSMVDALEQKIIILKSASNNMTAEDKKLLEKKLNQYVKAIDRCIGMMSE
jgi:hypothetical protein